MTLACITKNMLLYSSGIECLVLLVQSVTPWGSLAVAPTHRKTTVSRKYTCSFIGTTSIKMAGFSTSAQLFVVAMVEQFL